MYANKITPVQRMRYGNGKSRPRHPSKDGFSPSPKRRSLNASSTRASKKLNGDYHVLQKNVERERGMAHKARVALACTLDQLGEHHVRQQEYEDAMDAFTEALREKRSVFWHISSTSLPNIKGSEDTHRGSRMSMSSSLLSGTSLGDGSELSCRDKSSAMEHDKAIDEIVNTLRSIGNVHSLRGEQEEAMRYFTEVTSLRAQKLGSASTCDPTTSARESRSLLSALNDDTSTLMSEINEDVKALDDLFRSISFRNQSNKNTCNSAFNSNSKGHAVAATSEGPVVSCSQEKRKSKSAHTATPQGGVHPSNKRRKSDASRSSSTGNTNIVENEPFSRLSSPPSLPTTGNDISEAMDMYKVVLESYAGQRLDAHRELQNSLSLRAKLLQERRKKADSRRSRKPTMDARAAHSSEDQSLSKAADLELALEIYSHILVAHEESNQARRQTHATNQVPHQPLYTLASNSSMTSASSAASSKASASISEDEREGASQIASTLICMGSIYYKLGNRVEELRMYRKAKKVYQRVFGNNHIFVAGTRKNIGMVLAERGEYEEAMQQFDRAMQVYQHSSQEPSEATEKQNRDVASAISCMGNVKNRVGELEGALEHYMQALAIYKSLLTPSTDNESPAVPADADALRDVTATLKVIGMVHAKKGDLDTAMNFFQEAMALLRSSASSDDPMAAGQETTASVLTRIASIHLKKGDLDQAMGHYREAYDLTVRLRGTTDHPEVSGILHYIGGIYHKRAEYDEAMACYQEAIRIYHATLGSGNPTVAGTLVMVGSIYYKRRNLDNAMMFYREALRLNRDAYGMHHPDIAPILKSIGTILTKKGEYSEAYDVFRDVLSIKCTVHGTDHPEVASAYKSLGNVHYKLGDLADAERQYRHALSIYRRTKGEEHADTVSAKTTIEHLRYWMREREQRRDMEQRHGKSTPRSAAVGGGAHRRGDDERSC